MNMGNSLLQDRDFTALDTARGENTHSSESGMSGMANSFRSDFSSVRTLDEADRKKYYKENSDEYQGELLPIGSGIKSAAPLQCKKKSGEAEAPAPERDPYDDLADIDYTSMEDNVDGEGTPEIYRPYRSGDTENSGFMGFIKRIFGWK